MNNLSEKDTVFFESKVPYVSINGKNIKSKPVGYCTYGKHQGYLTVKNLKTHRCIKKNCKLLIENPNHEYIIQIHKIREYKEKNKKRAKLRKSVDSLWLNNKISYKEYQYLKKGYSNAKSDASIERLYAMVDDYCS